MISGTLNMSSVSGVITNPGCTEFTRIPSPAYWMAAAFVKLRFAPFAVGYEDEADPTMPYIDDTMTIDPPPALAHARYRVLRSQERSSCVYRHLQVEGFDRRLFHLVAYGGTRRLHQHVKFAEPVNRCRHPRYPIVLVRHVEVDVQCLTILGPDLRRRLLANLVLDVRDHDLRALTRKSPHRRATDAHQPSFDARSPACDQVPSCP